MSVTEIITVLSGAVVTLIIYLFSRRAQLRGLNTTSDATIVNSAAALVTSLQKQIEVLDARLARVEQERNTDRASFLEQLGLAHGENTRISIQVAQVQTDLDIARRQIEELRRRLPEITQRGEL